MWYTCPIRGPTAKPRLLVNALWVWGAFLVFVNGAGLRNDSWPYHDVLYYVFKVAVKVRCRNIQHAYNVNIAFLHPPLCEIWFSIVFMCQHGRTDSDVKAEPFDTKAIF